jgi:hypothetical protein
LKIVAVDDGEQAVAGSLSDGWRVLFGAPSQEASDAAPRIGDHFGAALAAGNIGQLATIELGFGNIMINK